MAAAGGSKRCGVVSCDRKHVYDKISGARVYSSYCQEHTCQAPRDEATPFCINPRGPANRYCAFHGKCRGARGCTVQASRSEKQPLPYICPGHRCAERHCARPRLGDLRVCEAHVTCGFRECRHRPQPGRRFCHAHVCAMAPSCAAPAVAPGAGHCHTHAPCGLVRGCRRQRMTLRDGRQAVHCDQHRPCSGAAQGCREVAAPRSGFCLAHKCALEGCAEGRDPGSHCCSHHTCRSPGCRQAKLDVRGRAAGYCSAHGCSADRCAREAKAANGFCAAHSCAHGSCAAGRLAPSPYCREHRCRHDGCPDEALRRNGFCRSHSCADEGCAEPRLGGGGGGGGDRVRLCLGHWTREVRRNAACEVGRRAGRERLRLEGEIRELEARERGRALADAEEEEERRRLAEEEDGRRGRERARAAREEADARRRDAADQRLADDLRRERLAREHIEEERRRAEEELRRLRDQGAGFAPRRATRFDDIW